MTYSIPTPTLGSKPRSALMGVGVPPPVVAAPSLPPIASPEPAPVPAPATAGPSTATRAAGQRQALMSSLVPGSNAGPGVGYMDMSSGGVRAGFMNAAQPFGGPAPFQP